MDSQALMKELNDLLKVNKNDELIQKYLQFVEQQNTDKNSIEYAALTDLAASAYFMKQQNDSALKYYQTACKIRQEKQPNTKQLAASYNNIALVLKSNGNFQESMNFFEKSLEIKKAINADSNDVSRTLNNIAICAKQLNNPENAIQYLEQAIQTNQQKGGQQQTQNEMAKTYKQINYQNNIAVIYKEKGDLENAEQYFLKAIPIYEQIQQNSSELAQIYFSLGNIKKEQKNPKMQLEFYLKSLEIRKQRQISMNLASIHQNIASLYAEMGMLALQIQHLLDAKTVIEQLNPQSEDALKIYTSLSQIFQSQNNLDQSKEYNQKIQQLMQTMPLISKPTKAILYNNYILQGLFYKQQQAQDEYIESLKASFYLIKDDVSSTYPDPTILAFYIAQSYLEKWDFVECEKWAKLAQERDESFVYSYYIIGKCKRFQGNYKEALEQCEKALQVYPQYFDAILLYLECLKLKKEWQLMKDFAEKYQYTNQGSYQQDFQNSYLKQKGQFQLEISQHQIKKMFMSQRSVLGEEETEKIELRLLELPQFEIVDTNTFSSKLLEFLNYSNEQLYEAQQANIIASQQKEQLKEQQQEVSQQVVVVDSQQSKTVDQEFAQEKQQQQKFEEEESQKVEIKESGGGSCKCKGCSIY